jgi:hypothetical protein
MYLNFGKYLYTIIYVLIALILAMMFLSYFNIDLKQNTNANIKLTRAAVFEGYKHNANNANVNSDSNTDAIVALNSIL